MRKSKKKCSRIENHNRRGFACPSEPLYNQSDFLYYFENRLKQMIANEFDAHFRECFYNMPF